MVHPKMFKGHSILAVIPAKKKSRRLPGKNIKLFAGKPLIAWSIIESRKSRFLDEIIVSTEDDGITKISRRLGVKAPFKRPSSLTKEHISSMDVARHAATWFEKKGKHFDYIMILQPTSPLRTASDVDESIKQFLKKEADVLISVVRVIKSPFWLKRIKKGYLEDLFKRKSKRSKRREALYLPNGAIFIIKTKALLSKKIRKKVFYLMDNSRSIDIDDQLDFKIAQWLMQEKLETIKKARQ